MSAGNATRIHAFVSRLRHFHLSRALARRLVAGAVSSLTWPFTVDSPLPDLSGSTKRPLDLGRRGPEGFARERASDSDVDGLIEALRAARHRLWVARSVAIAARGLALVALVALVGSASLLLGSRVLALIALPIGLLLVLLVAILIAFQRITELDAARVLDRQLGLRERVATAVSLLNSADGGAVATRQIVDTSRLAADPTLRRAISPRLPRRDLVRAAGSLAITLALVVANSLVPARGAPVDAAALEPNQQAAEISAGDWTELAETDPGSLDSRGDDPETARKLAELKRQLESGEISAQQYADRVATLEDGLRERAAESARQQESLARLADALKDSSATRDVANSLNRGDYAAAAQQMGELADQADRLSEQARQEMADNLSAAAEQVGEHSPTLADAAKRSADALRQGDRDDARSEIRELSEQMADAGEAVTQQSDAGRALQQVREAQAQADAGDSERTGEQQVSQAEGQGDPRPGDGTGEGPSVEENMQPSERDGQNDGGGGAGSGPGSRTVDRDPSRDPNGSGESVMRIDGKPTDAGDASRQDTTGTPLTTTSGGTSAVQATDSFRQSDDPVNTIGEQNYVPFEMKPVVKDYFSGQSSEPIE